MSLIRLAELSKRYAARVAVERVSLEVAPGELFVLLGPSGGGKSTLLRLIAGLERPDQGSVEIDGRDVTGLPPQRRDVGFCFQHYAPFRHLSVFENIAFGLRVRRQPSAQVRARVEELLELVHLEGEGRRRPHQLSGGQLQRMALARALASRPRLLLLDEPFSALDANVRHELRSWLRWLHRETGITTLLVTHDQEEAMELADRLAVIHEGRLVQAGSPEQLYDHPQDDFVLTFLGPITRFQGAFVRPHDLVLRETPAPGTVRATVGRVHALGFEVRAELEAEGESGLWVQLDRGSAQELALCEGRTIWVQRREPEPVRAPLLAEPA